MLTKISTPARLLIMQGFVNCMVLIPVVMAFYQHVGQVTVADFLFIQGVFRVAAMLLEVPTGYLADHIPRHRQIQLAVAVHALGHATLWLVASNMAHIIVAEGLFAFASAMISGTIQAYLHEALRAEGKQAEATKWQGRQFATCMGAETLAAPLGGWLFSLHVYAPIAISTILDGVGLLVALTLPHVPMQKGERRHSNKLKDLWAIMHHTTRVHPVLVTVISGPYIMYAFTAVMFWGMLAQLNAVGTSPTLMGWYLAIYMGTMALTGWGAQAIIHRVGARVLWRSMPVMLLLGTGIVVTADTGLQVILGGVLAYGFTRPIASTLSTVAINTHVPDHERATTLSVANMVTLTLSSAYLLSAPLVLQWVTLGQLLTGLGLLTAAVTAPAFHRLAKQSET